MSTITTAFPSPTATAKKLGVTRARLVWIQKQAALAGGHTTVVKLRKKKTTKRG
jgi:hypothetical protein